MSLKLSPKHREAFCEAISKAMPNLKVDNEKVLNWDSAWSTRQALKEAIPKSGPLKEELVKIISENPLFDFVYQSIADNLSGCREYKLESPQLALTDIDGYKEPDVMADRLMKELESLPWNYSFTIKIPNDFGKLIAATTGTYELSDWAKLITPDANFVQNFPIKGDDPTGLFAGLFAFVPRSPSVWEPSNAYLQFTLPGFVGSYSGQTATLDDAISVSKSFFGMLMALDILEKGSINAFDRSRGYLTVHLHSGTEKRFVRSYAFDESVSQTYLSLTFSRRTNLEIGNKSDEEAIKYCRYPLAQIGGVLKYRADAERLMLAAEWLFESYCEPDELHSFVQAAVVAEILLGDESIADKVGLAELLANRCAYMLSIGQEQREEIYKEFKKIYTVRSKIVHAGKRRLTEDERALLWNLKYLCRQILSKEIELFHLGKVMKSMDISARSGLI